MTELIWSFAPWVAFLLGVRVGNVYWGAGIGAAVAIVVLTRALSRHRAHLFDGIGVVYFVGMLVLLAVVHPGDVSTWGRYAQAVAHGSLTLIVFGSVLINRPFTESYAREQAPKEVWAPPPSGRSTGRFPSSGGWPSSLGRQRWPSPVRRIRGRSFSASSSPLELWLTPSPSRNDRRRWPGASRIDSRDARFE